MRLSSAARLTLSTSEIGMMGTGPLAASSSGKTLWSAQSSRKEQRDRPRYRDCQRRCLTGFVREAVSHPKVNLLVTDQWTGYRHLNKEYPHAVIKHTDGEYVVGAVHTNTIEGFWSIFKRGCIGTFHKVSRKYLPLYVAEFKFRYNAIRRTLTFLGLRQEDARQ